MELLATEQLAALSHTHRLALFRLLVRRHPEAVPAGKLAEALSLKANTASTYLANLKNARLITQRRSGKSLLYKANLDTAATLIQFLFTDCCQERLPLCVPSNEPLKTKETGEPPGKLNLLFLCTGNSARSIIAEAVARDVLGDDYAVFSAGTKPASVVNPLAMDVLVAHGHGLEGLNPKDLLGFQKNGAPEMALVITLCDVAANEDCPKSQGHPVNCHWGLIDPAASPGNLSERRAAFGSTYKTLSHKISELAKLDLQTTSREDLQTELDRIGTL